MAIKLIIADDAAFIREVIRNIAETAGMVILGEAIDGKEAVSMALKARPDVILMDIVMPEMSGIDASREIIEEWPEARILAISTLDQDTMVANALEAGCRDYLTKPFESAELIKAIEGCVDNKQHGGS